MFYLEKKKEKISYFLIGVLFLLNIFAWEVVFNLSGPRYLEVIFFDVGQGDAIFIETPARQQVLVDGGPNSRILEKLSKEMPFYDRTLDLIILTHPEKDHLAGLLEVLKRYKIKSILWTGVVRDTAEWKEWTDLIGKERAQIKIAEAGERIVFETREPEIYIDILNPKEKMEGVEIKDSNDSSIVGRLVVDSRSLLLTGDISAKIEKILSEEKIDSDVLKVAHHGSKYSSSEDFLKMVLPAAAVITVGENSYGHPTLEVLQRLQNFGINILRTDEDGDIKIISDGRQIKIIR